jgi:uncharacterized protein (TIGR03435 family)
MNAVQAVLNQPWMARAGWALLHFLWQGAMIALLFALVRRFAGASLTARGRYLLACATLAIMTSAPLLTFFVANSAGYGDSVALRWRPGTAALERALPWIVVLWLCGAVVFSVRLLGAWRFTKKLRTVAIAPASPEWQEKLDQIIRRIGVTRAVRLLVSSVAEVPMVIGWLRPVVLMPVAALAGLPADQVEALLAHELAHIWRNDYLINLLQSVAEAMLFYHPAVWWVSGQIRIERELCCDDVAVEATGDVLTYVRALTDLETRRRARLNTALAADGGSLVSRVRRLIAEPQPLSRSLPAAGAAWAVSLLWLTAIGAATVHGAPAPVKAAVLVPPPAMAPVAPPLVKAVLFDPFFPPQQAPQEAHDGRNNHPRASGGMRANRIDLVYIPAVAEPPRQSLEFSGPAWILPPPGAFSQIYESTLNSGDPASVNAAGSGSLLSTTCPVSCAEFETWVEGLSGDYVESISTELSVVDRSAGKTTLQRFVGDDQRHVYITYTTTMERLPEAGTYRVTITASAPAVPAWMRPAADSKLISPANYPVPQILRDGDTLAVELYTDDRTGRRLVDYIHIGQNMPIFLRTAPARDAYTGDAEFSMVHPRLSVNGQGLESLSGTMKGRMLWVFIPGQGRFLLSLQPHPASGFEEAGEVNGKSLTFAARRNVFRIDGAERISSMGSAVYRIYALQDPAWQPADPADRTHFMIGSAPAIETAGTENNKGDAPDMRATMLRSGLLAFAMNAAFAQGQTGQSNQAPAKLEFEVASVRVSTPPGPPVRGQRGGPGTDDPTRITYTFVTMQGLLVWAFGLPIDQISGPSWWTTEHYDISAKVPPSATKDDVSVMLQNLLAERFNLKEHLVKKDFDAYELTVAKGGLKMKESVIDPKLGSTGAPEQAAALRAGRNLGFKDGFPVLAPGNSEALRGMNVNGRMLITARQQEVDSIVRTLQNALGAGNRVIDKTGLTGTYDFHLQYARPNNNAAAQNLPEGSTYLDSIGEPAPDIVIAAREQLGLVLTKGKVAVDVLVVDHADRVPTEN